MKNHTFKLLQFHYGDESCTLALYTLTARGRYRLRSRSWVTPGATEAEYTLTRVTVTAHSAEVAEELAARVNSTCPGQVRRRWKPYRDYVVLSLPEEVVPNNNHPPTASSSRHQLRMMVTEDMDCLSGLHAVFHEMQLLRVQRRPRGPPDNRHPRHELLLDRTWHGEYRFYADPSCTVPTFTATASGRYSHSSTTSNKVEGGTDFDFRVERASLTVLDRGMAENLQGDPRCIPGGLWKVGVPRDLTPSRGCAPLGIIVPSTEYELVRVEIDAQGNPLLLMGQPDTENRKRGPKDRPTAYQLPLIHCRSLSPFSPNHNHYHHPDDDFEDNHLFPMSHARIGLRSSANVIKAESAICLFVIFVVLRTINFV
ncbi:Protein APCDD1 [Blattella germanica]|nr:Protein APCDD1 [Blattella germanica]